MGTIRKLRRPRIDEELAFVADPAKGGAIVDDEVESFAEEFIASITGGESVVEDARNEETIDELGGPFLEIEAPLLDAAGIPYGEDADTEEVTTAGE